MPADESTYWRRRLEPAILRIPASTRPIASPLRRPAWQVRTAICARMATLRHSDALLIGTYLLQGYATGRDWVGSQIQLHFALSSPTGPHRVTYPAWVPRWFQYRHGYTRYLDAMSAVATTTLHPAGWLILAAVVVSSILFLTTNLGHGIPLLVPMVALPWLSILARSIVYSPWGYDWEWDVAIMIGVWSLFLIAAWWLFGRRIYLIPPGVPEIDLTPRPINSGFPSRWRSGRAG